ncbi:hypothetical protein BKA62DRAFT_403666 [Auriculariales sp. MPI-PUGE-AT-0066]|nr:hypothetical protein BKA62DRAFT_403666 [Auriculariales sp. MPI-PUGE-AT-0066]
MASLTRQLISLLTLFAFTGFSSATAANFDWLFPIPWTSAFTSAPNPPQSFDVHDHFSAVTLNDSGIGLMDRAGGLPSPIVAAPDGVMSYQASYPQGSFKPSGPAPGGFGFYFGGPKNFSFENADEILVSYAVYFPDNFDWWLGGKLPGPFGGTSQQQARACSGGRQEDRDKCFSMRLMWREHGDGEIYLYAPKTVQNNVSAERLAGTVFEDDFGISVARGAFQFTAGAWTTVAQRVRLNDIGQTNGEIELWTNGKSVIHATGLEIRVHPETTFRGVHAQTFFGGNTSDWATPVDQKTYFAHFSGAVVPQGASPADGQAAYPLSSAQHLWSNPVRALIGTALTALLFILV